MLTTLPSELWAGVSGFTTPPTLSNDSYKNCEIRKNDKDIARVNTDVFSSEKHD